MKDKTTKPGKMGNRQNAVLIIALLFFVCLIFVVFKINDKRADSAVHEESFFAMDTYMSVKCYGKKGEEAAKEAKKELQRLDKLLSDVESDSPLTDYSADVSEILRLNEEGTAEAGPEVTYLVKLGAVLSDRTDGAYDLTVVPLIDLWGFTSGNYHVATQEEIDDRLKYVDYTQVVVEFENDDHAPADKKESDEAKAHAEENGSRISLGEGQKIGLGSIAKGYASGNAAELIRSLGVESAILSLGGNIQCVGTRPDGSPWKVGIRDPRDPDDQGALLGTLEAEDTAVITSGTYERYFEGEDGTIYHHILDPKTGRPAGNGMLSVTIVSADAAMADALSTACFVLGPEKACAYWREYGAGKNNDAGEAILGTLPFEMIYMTDEEQLFATAGLKDRLVSEEIIHWVES